MRRACLIALLLAAGASLGCHGPNPRFRLHDGGGTGTGGTGSGGTGGTSGAGGSGSRDADTLDGAAIDTEPPVDVSPVPDGPIDPDGAVTTEDTGAPDLAPDLAPDVAPDQSADLPPDTFTPPAGCGTGVSNVAGILNADGLVVDTDGFIYTLNDDASNSYVGKLPPGGAADDNWLTVTSSPTTYGLALDSPAHILYVLVVDGTGAIVRFQNIKGTAVGDQLYASVDNGNDVVVGPDGDVYYTQQGDGHVYAVTPSKARRRVTTSRVGTTTQLPAALTFEPDGHLLVGTEEGPIYRITLAGGTESARVALTGWAGWANGLTHDRRGRLYVALYHDTQPRSVLRLDVSGNVITATTSIAPSGRYSSIAFGRGALDCRDLYIANPHGPMQRVRVNDVIP